MRTITKDEFDSQAAKEPYYRHRWQYYKEVIDIVNEINPKTVLELGPHTLPIMVGGDVMDIAPKCGGETTYEHDATQIPWPINDDSYDLFIALQVWEHLDTDPNDYLDPEKQKQREAFGEVQRIAKKAIISFPFMWHWPNNHHHQIDHDIIARWTCDVKPVKTIMTGDKDAKQGARIIYYFDFADGKAG